MLAGWHEHVEPSKQTSLFWNFIWKECGKPKTGVVAETARRTRARYHYNIRALMRDIEVSEANKLAESIAKDSQRDFWKEIKRITNSKKPTPTMVDGIQEDEKICDLFKNKFETLYQSVPYDQGNMYSIESEINNRIKQLNAKGDLKHDLINYLDVKKAITKIKKGKSDGFEGLYSDSLINGPDSLYVIIALVFNSLITHDIVIDELLISTMTPIPKGKTVMYANSDKFRAITLSSLIGKLFDLIIIMKQSDLLITDKLQFGFKEGVSTTLCTAMMLETAAWYNNKNTNVYALFLDATKAFDRINYCTLFKKLINRNVSCIYLRFLLNMYTKQLIRIKWNNTCSEYFNVTNGVKQGGVLSPLLFSIYIDDLLSELRVQDIGCKIGSEFCGVYGYADDVVLLSPTVSGLKSMVKTCTKYANDHDVQFNSLKSQIMVFSNKKQYYEPIIYMNDEPIKIVKEVNNLGHVVYNDVSERDTAGVISSFNKCVNMFLNKFKRLKVSTKKKLFKNYCCSYYGTMLFCLESKDIQEVCTAHRKGIRKVFNLPYRTHCKYLPIIGEMPEAHSWFCKRFLKMFVKSWRSSNNLINYISHVVINEHSIWGKNIRYLLYKLNCTPSFFNDDTIYHVANKHFNMKTNNEDTSVVSTIIELLDISTGHSDGILSKDECRELLRCLCED